MVVEMSRQDTSDEHDIHSTVDDRLKKINERIIKLAISSQAIVYDCDCLPELSKIDNKILDLEKQLDRANRHRRALINNNNLNKWPDDNRIDVIGQNGNTGEHY
jgi:hypothetical protein